MNELAFSDNYKNIDFRIHPEKYKIGKGEQGVLTAEPYKSEILPYWRFATPEIAKKSARNIYALFGAYKRGEDFVGMDMVRKFLQMGFTRARRYANHADGRKYARNGSNLPQDKDSEDSDKAKSAQIFYDYYIKVREDPKYKELRQNHLKRTSSTKI